MGVRNARRQELLRLEAKTLEAQFLTEIQGGLNCSPFESEAVLQVVREVYGPYFAQVEQAPPAPGKLSVIAVCADEPAGKPIAQCEKRVVLLTLHRGAVDDRLLQQAGPAAFRRARIPELCQEALSQGALLTREDLAYRIFSTSPRSISRDLAALREQEPPPPLPLRSTVHDIGPVLSHRVQIVQLALAGKTMTQICRQLRHSPAAVANYLSTFVRVAQLAEKNLSSAQIAFLLGRGPGLIDRYLELLHASRENPDYLYQLEQMLQRGAISGKKKRAKGGR
jgi:DNA-binding NarL/FixJ family response regulator